MSNLKKRKKPGKPAKKKKVGDPANIGHHPIQKAKTAMEAVKVRDATDKQIYDMLYRSSQVLGVQPKQIPDEETKELYYPELRKEIGGFTIQEFNLAVKLAIKGTLDLEVPDYPNPSIAFYIRVMEDYRSWKGKNHIYKTKQPPKKDPEKEKEEAREIMINATKKRWQEYQEQGKIKTKSHNVFEWLRNNNLIDLSSQEYEEIYEKAKNLLEKKYEKEKDKAQAEGNRDFFRKLITKLEDMDKDDRVKIEARELALEYYFKNYGNPLNKVKLYYG